MSVVLSEHLPLLASAPDGIQKLRGLILELAVRGKLVPQDPNAEPASELLKRIAKERARLEVEGVCKKSKPVPPVGEDEQPFALPDGWHWVRFSSYALDVSTGPFGSMLHQSDYRSGGIPLVNPSHMIGGRIVPESHIAVDEAKATELSSYRLRCGDIVMARRGEVGRTALVTEEEDGWLCGTGSFVIRMAKDVSRNYVVMLFRAPSIRRYLGDEAVGTTMVNLNHGILNAMPLALPPLAEQHRIVAKVDELMALCDRLEAEQTDADAAHAKLVDTQLGTLTQSTDAAELAANWQRLAEHFDTLFTTESSLDALKQTILQLAVMGRLVPQDSNDEPTTELFKRVAKERARLEADGAYKKSKTTPAVSKAEQPSGWRFATLPELCDIGGGATPSKANSAYWGEGLPWVSPKDMKVDQIFDAQDHVTDVALSETRLARIPAGSLLVVVRGMILAHSFPVATTQVEVAINQDMKSLTPFIRELQPYLALMLRGWKSQILGLVDRSTHGTCKLQSEKLFGFEFGIPPLAEQHRIVAKVDELMALCDRLKADLAESRTRQGRLSATLIESALQAA